MKSSFSIKRIFLALTAVLGSLVLLLGWLCLHALDWSSFQQIRTVTAVKRDLDVRWANLGGFDLRDHAGLIATWHFNLRTAWPDADHLPPTLEPGWLLTNAMNPGLGIHALHRQGITGRGVRVAIIDQYLPPEHPEYASKIVAQQNHVRPFLGSMHGPAVASLLVGTQCGVAPEARLYYVTAPDGEDAGGEAKGLDWIVEQNRHLPVGDKIRVVSVSACPSGKTSIFHNGQAWDDAVARAEAEGIMVIDATVHHGFLAPCNLDPTDQESPAGCAPIPALKKPGFFKGRLLVPVAPRTTAETYRKGWHGFQYCGWQDAVFNMHGTSWSMPYCSGVLALGWQIAPKLTPQRMKQLLFQSAYVRPDGEKVINPQAFIALVKLETSVTL